MTRLLIHIYSLSWLDTVPTLAWIVAGGSAVAVTVGLGIGRIVRNRDRQQSRRPAEDDTWFDGYVRGGLDDEEV